MFILDVGVQTAALCPGGMITKRDEVTGEYECVPCLKCPAGYGLSVNCGDVITPQTPIVCQPCVLGETYSSANEPGACKDCENCLKYRETSKACTLTSKAVCGKCKVGAYPDGLLSICKPCSYCCNDGKDIVIPACQVSGVAAGMQCTYLRSCPKTAAKPDSKASLSTASTMPSRSTAVTLSTPYPTATTITAQGNRSNEEQGIQYRQEQEKNDGSKGATFSPSKMVGVIVGSIATKAVFKASLSTSSTVPSRSAAVTLSTPYPTATKITAQGNRSNEEQGTQNRGEQVKSDDSKGFTFSLSEMVGVIVGLIFAFALVGLVWKFKPNIKQAVKRRHNAAPGDAEIESGIPLQHLQGEDTGSEIDELQTPVDIRNPLEQLQGGAETNETQMAVVLPNGDTSSPVQESEDSPEPLPVQDTQRPNGLDGRDKVFPRQDTQPPGGFEGQGKNQN